MGSYPTTPADHKHSVAIAIAPSGWSLAARLARTWARNRRFTRGAGSRRRSKMEYRLVAGQDWLRHVLRGEATDGGGGRIELGRSIQLAELARAHLGRFAPSSARLRQLVQLVTTTGPASGWCFTDERTGGPEGRRYVRLYLPRRSEPAARGWLRLVRELRALLSRVGQLASRLIPALRSSSNTARSTTVWRDHQPAGTAAAAWLEALRRRWCPDTAM